MVVFEHGPDNISRMHVREPEEAGDPAAYLAGLDRIGSMTAPFGMIVDIAGHLHMSHEERKAQNLWFKATRAHMNATCKAAAIVRLEPTPEMQATFAGLWTFPVLVTGSVEAAETFVRSHLAETVQ